MAFEPELIQGSFLEQVAEPFVPETQVVPLGQWEQRRQGGPRGPGGRLNKDAVPMGMGSQCTLQLRLLHIQKAPSPAPGPRAMGPLFLSQGLWGLTI